MDYRAEIQRFLDNDKLGFEEWISGCPITEAPTLILEYKSYMQKLAIENDDFEAVQDLQELDDFAQRIENFAIDTFAERQEKLNEVIILQQKFQAIQEKFAQSDSKTIDVSNNLLDELREIVNYLKSQGLYDAETWKNLQHLL
jgi:hypothetical protein